MHYFILARLFFDSGTEYVSSRQVTHPNYVYEARVKEWGYIDRSIPVPSGLPQLGDCRIQLIDTDYKWRDIGAHQTFRRRFLDFRMVREGESESAQPVFATFEIFDDEWTAGLVDISGRDINFSWIDKPIPGLINRANFPGDELMEGVDEAFLSIVAGILDAPSDASPPNPQGVLTLPRMTLSRWGLAQHPVAYVELCGRIENEVEFSLIDPSEYEITEEPHTINGIDYTLSFIDFLEERDSGQEVRCRIIEGFYSRGEFAGMPAIANSPLSGLRNPIDALINILYGVLKTETRIPRFNADSFTALRDKFNTSFVTTVSPAIGYSCDGAIDRPTTVRQFLADWQASFEVDLFVNNKGEITVSATFETDPDRVVFSQGPVFGELTDNSLIGLNSLRQKRASPTCNRLHYNSQLNYATDEFAAKEVFDNEDDQNALGANQSPVIPVIEEDTLEQKWVRIPAIAQDVARRRMEFLALGSIRAELQLPLDQTADLVDLAQLVGVTHQDGLEVGGFHNKEFKTTGITDDMDQMVRTLRIISRVPQTIDQAIHEEPTAENTFTGETYIEALDYGIVASDEAGTFFRSAFYIPPDLTNLGFDDERIECFIEGVAENLEASPVLWKVGAHGDGITVPANYAGRVRSSTAFDRRDESTFYITSPVVATGSTLYRLRMAIQHTRARKVYSEIQMSNSFGATGLDQTIGGGDIFRTTSWGLPGSLSGFVSIGGPRFKYVAADWDTITNVRIVAAVANASFHLGPDDPNPQSSEVSLWDLDQEALMEDDPGMVAIMQCSGEAIFLSPRLFVQDVNVLSLVDGHTYELRIRSVKDNVDQNDFNTYFHRGRLGISVSPIQSVEFHERVGSATGPGETQMNYPATTVPESSVHFQAHDAVDLDDMIELVDLGASDIATSGTPVAASGVLITDAVTKQARTEDIAAWLIDGDRYAVGDVLQGELVTKIPPKPIVLPFTPATFRQQYLADLYLGGYPAVIAVLFEEGSGAPTEFFTGASLTSGGSPSWTTDMTYGSAGRAAAITDYWKVNDCGLLLPANRGTLLVIRKKADTTPRDSNLAGLLTDFFGRWFSTHAPVANGNVRFNIVGNYLTNGGYAPSTDLEAWAFRFSPTGRLVQKDQSAIATDAVAATRLASNASDDFGINNASSDYSNGDIQDFFFVALFRSDIPDAILAQFTVDKVLLGT